MKRSWPLALVLLALFAACSSPAPSSPSSPAVTLAGTSWVVSRIVDTDTLPAARPTIAFVDQTLSGSASCNQFSGQYTQNGDVLTIGETAITAMACTEQSVMTQEAAFLAALGSVKVMRAAGTNLELLNADEAAVLILEPAAPVDDKPLTETTWSLSGIVSGETASSPVADTTVTFSITGNTLAGKACNTFRGPITVDGSGVKIGPLATTRMACPNQAESTQEAAVLKILESATTYQIRGADLTVTAPDGAGLRFRAA